MASNRATPVDAFDDVILRFNRVTVSDDPTLFQASVQKSPVPLQGGQFKVDPKQLTLFRTAFRSTLKMSRMLPTDSVAEETASINDEDLLHLGDQLYSLLPQTFVSEFPRLFQQTLERGRGVRLILEVHAGEAAEVLLSLPWELLAFREMDLHLARSRRFLIVRRLLEAARRSPLALESPLDVLHLFANDPSKPIERKLWEGECRAIREAIVPGNHLPVGDTEPGSIQALLAALDAHPCQVLHILAHGEVQSRSRTPDMARREESWLRFVGEAGIVQPVTGAHLQALLNSTPRVQLIVMNACHGGSAAAPNIAFDLVQHGFPYVVAMQEEIDQTAAETFTKAFYRALKDRDPIEYAVAAGRTAIAQDHPTLTDWCLPVLYTNVGLPEKEPLEGLVDRLWHWFGHEARTHLSQGFQLIGAGGFIMGVLLLLSGAVVEGLPTNSFLLQSTLALFPIPPLLMMLAYKRHRHAIPSSWQRSARLLCLVEMGGVAAITLGGFSCTMWLLFFMVAATGLWTQITPWIQAGVYTLLLAIFSLFSYTQAIWWGRLFLTDPNAPNKQGARLGLVGWVGGYIMLCFPLLATVLWRDLLTSPLSTVALGATFFILGRALRPESEVAARARRAP